MPSPARRLPDFLFIGPDKTGSSWLYKMLQAHPDSYVPPIKDIYFFDRYYERGLDWYLEHFREVPADARVMGELSHDYLFSPLAAERIQRDLPEVRLMTCLRDPIDRTHSHYLYLVRSGLTRAPFEQALEDFPELIDNSLYAKHLGPYFDIFPRARIKVLYFDQLKSDSAGFAAEAFRFLELPVPDDLAYDSKVLPASKPRSYLLAKTAKMGANLARDLGLAPLVGRVKNSRLAKLLYKPYAKDEKPVMQSETRAHLKQVFRPDVDALERLLGVNLSHWMKD